MIEAAEYVELASLDTVTVTIALENWFHERPTLTGEQLLHWWRELDAGIYKDREAWLQAVSKLDPLQS